MHRAFVHLELNTDDVDRARDFYRDVLGWSFNSVDMGGDKYVQIATPKPPGGGIQVKPQRTMASAWMPYVLVEDVLSTVTRARRAGGKVVVDRTVMPGFGVLAIMTDPTGATFAVWEVANGKSARAPAVDDDERTHAEEARRAAAKQRALERKQAAAERRAEAKERRAAAKEARRQAREERRVAAAEAKRKRAEAKQKAEREAAQRAKQQAAAEKQAKAKAKKKAAEKKAAKKAAPKAKKKPAAKKQTTKKASKKEARSAKKQRTPKPAAGKAKTPRRRGRR
jgi:hypothetical protein